MLLSTKLNAKRGYFFFIFKPKVHFICPITHVVDELCIRSMELYIRVVIINIQLLHTFGNL